VIKFNCKPDDGELVEMVADSRDILEWEVRKNGRHLGMIQATPRMSDLTELAWLTCRRRGVWTGELSDFRKAVAVEPVERFASEREGEDGDGLLDPTRTAV
jgi:hypothetical protein